MNQVDIDVVIIGIDVEKFLTKCIDSIIASDYPKEKLHIIYADGGSKDKSISIAESFSEVKIVRVNDDYPTPGKGRNAGYKAGSSPLIQFLDADTILNPNWFKNAIPYFSENVKAVCGRRKELYPVKNLYHKITDIEWNYEFGPCRYFGGEVLLERKVIENVNGFDPDLIAGEDPELSYRIRQSGITILRIDADMTLHDINMSRFAQYFKRAFRTGYAYAEVGLRFRKNREKMWLRELIRTTLSGLIPIFFPLTGIIFYFLNLNEIGIISILLGFLFPFRVLLKIPGFARNFRISYSLSVLYCLHLVLNAQLQFMGVIRYVIGKIFKNPLTNRKLK